MALISTLYLFLGEAGLACPDIKNIKSMAQLFRCTVTELLNGAFAEAHRSSNLPFAAVQDTGTEEPCSAGVSVAFDLDSTKSISPLLFGDNLEHTRACINGGLSAQMLKNRKFVGKPGRYGCALDWFQIGEQTYLTFGEPYTCHFEGYRMRRSHECSAQVITNYHGRSPAGIGQKGIFLKADTAYAFVLTAKAFADTEVTVRLLSSGGTVYAQQSFLVRSGDFAPYRAELLSAGQDDDAVLEIFFTAQGTVTVGAVSLMPADNFRGMRVDVIEKMKELGIRLLRWPGGNFAGEYNWKDGLLPCDRRAPLQSYLWLETQPHTHGYDFHEINTDDFLALCKEIGAEPFITINPTWNTPEESAQWVEYCNGSEDTPFGALRAKNGHAEPYHVQFWSLGNEFGYSHMEGVDSPAEYSRIVRTHAEEMLRVSPNLCLCSSGPYPHEDWAKYSAKPLRDIAPAVSLHHYAVPYPDYIDPQKRKEEYEIYIQKVYTEYLPKIREMRAQLNDDGLKISFDEWNAWYAWYRGGSVTEGIFAASFLNMLYMNADRYGVQMACHFESVNEGAIRVHPDRVSLTPTGQVFSILKEHAGGRVCALQTDVIATSKNGAIHCTLINRSFDESKTFTLPSTADIAAAVLYSSEDVVPNTVFEQSTLTVETTAQNHRAVLPPHSIAQLVIRQDA